MKKSIRIFLISFLSFFFIFTIFACSGNNTKNDNGEIEDINSDQSNGKYFKIGEKIKYELTALIGHIANQTIEVLDIKEYKTDKYNEEYNGTKCYYVLSETRTIPSVEKVYKIDSKIYSYIDYNTLLPIMVKKETVETNYKDTVEIYFDQKNKNGVYKSHRKLSQFPDGINFEWKNEGGLLYLVSAIFYLRTQELSIDDEITINVFDEKTLSPIENNLVVKKGEPYKDRIGSIEILQANEENEKINSISMRVINYKGINWLPVDIRIGFFKLGNKVVKMEGVLSSYKSSAEEDETINEGNNNSSSNSSNSNNSTNTVND